MRRSEDRSGRQASRRLLVVPLFFLCATASVTGVSAQLPVAAGAADITVSGRLHVQYGRSSVDGDAGAEDAVDDVFLRRARIQLNLRMSEALDGRLEADFAGGAALSDAWVRLTFGPALRLSAGQFKRAFSVFELASSTDLPIVERDGRIEGVDDCPGVGEVCSFSRLAERLQFDDRDVGLRAEGALGDRVSYLATLTNGEGKNAPDVNDTRSVSGRLTVEARDDVRLAGFVGRHDYLGPSEEGRTALAFGADLEVGSFRDGFHVLAGAHRGDNWRVGPEARFTAAQGLASRYFALAEGGRFVGVEPLLRVSFARTEDEAGVDHTALLVTPGISLYVAGKNFIILNFDRYDPDPGPTEWSLKVQALVFF